MLTVHSDGRSFCPMRPTRADRAERGFPGRPAWQRAVGRLGLTVALVGTSLAVQAAGVSGSLESTDTIHVAIFPLDAGTIYVNVPDDLRPGETGSATVNPMPAGAGADQTKNREELKGYSVVLAGQPARASEAVRPFKLPAGAKTLSIVLLDPGGRRLSEVHAPLGSASPGIAGYEVPAHGQSGAPVRIAGPFDGDLSNSSVQIDGRTADPMAESPRQLVVRGPREGVSEAPIEVRDRGTQVTTGTYRNVGVSLSAGATTLRSGETTTLTITVTGVEGLRESLPVRLTNHSSTVVRMEGGEEQTLCVRPDDVSVTGTWRANRGLTGVKLGGFSITTKVSQPRPHAESNVRISAALYGELRAGLVLERPTRTPVGQALRPGPYAVMIRGDGEGGKVSLHLAHQGKLVGTLPGVVTQRARSATICDKDDDSDAVDQARAGTGDSTFGDLGFQDGELFELRGIEGGLLLVLPTDEEHFSIEASLPSPMS